MTRIGINGFGRIGRLVYRLMSSSAPTQLVHINEPAGSPEVSAYLANHDTVHGRAPVVTRVDGNDLVVAGQRVSYSQSRDIDPADWSGCDIVLECSGKYRTAERLEPFFAAGVRSVIVAAPVKQGALNVVMGVNDHRYNPSDDRIVTAASCTTNALAPIAAVINRGLGITHGMITTLHCMTNSQSVVDKPASDIRRTRSASHNLIPTTTGSASTIGMILPELNGKLDGLAIRVPQLGASVLDCVFEVARPTTVAEVNALLTAAADSDRLRGILAVETAPLVSSDYRSDPHSAIVDAQSTMVTAGTQVKIIAWYDNEMGYSHRMHALTAMVAAAIGPR